MESAVTNNGTENKRKGMGYPTMALMTVTAAVLLINYVETMVIPGIPVIQADFGTSETIASWITSAFLIVGAAVAPLFGKLGDVYGKKRMFLVVLVFYIAGIALAGVSDSIYTLLVARAIQGVGFAVLPLAIAIVTDVFPRERVATAQGIISGMVAIGTTLGLVIGAYVVEDLGWHYAFYTALILSLLLFVMVVKVLKKDTPGTRSKMDYTGTAILMAGITLSLIYLTEGPSLGWTSLENLGFLIPGLALTIIFFVYESRKEYPLIQLSLLRVRNVLLANLVGIVSGMTMFLAFFAVVYYAELPKPYGLGLDTISTGLSLAPATVVMMVVGPIVGRLMPRFGPKPIIVVGSVIMALGFALFLFYRGTVFELTFDSAVTFIGAIAVMIPMVNMISVSLPRDCTTVGLGLNSMVRNLGGAIGPVLATSIMTTWIVTVYVTVQGQLVPVSSLPSSTAFDIIFMVGIALTTCIAVLSLAIKNYTFGKEKSVEEPVICVKQ